MESNRCMLFVVHSFILVALILSSAAIFGQSIYIMVQQETRNLGPDLLLIISPTISFLFAIFHLVTVRRTEHVYSTENSHPTSLQKLRMVLATALIIIWAISLAVDSYMNRKLWTTSSENAKIEQCRLAFASCALLSSCVLWVMIVSNCFRRSTTNQSLLMTNPRKLLSNPHSSHSMLGFPPAATKAFHPHLTNSKSCDDISSVCSTKVSNCTPHAHLQRMSSDSSFLPPIAVQPPLFSYPIRFQKPPIFHRRSLVSSTLPAIHPPEHPFSYKSQYQPQNSYRNAHLRSQVSHGSLNSNLTRHSSSTSTAEARSHRHPRHASSASSRGSSSMSSRRSSSCYTNSSTSISTRSSTSGTLRKSRLSIMTTVEEPPEHDLDTSHNQADAASRQEGSSLQSHRLATVRQDNNTRTKREAWTFTPKDAPPVPRVPDLAKLQPVQFGRANGSGTRPASVIAKNTAATIEGNAGRGARKRDGMKATSLKPSLLVVVKPKSKIGKVVTAKGRRVQRSSTKLSKTASLVGLEQGSVGAIQPFLQTHGSGSLVGDGVIQKEVNLELAWRLEETAREFGVSVQRALLRV